MREQLDKENSRCKESGEKENERREVETCLVGKIVDADGMSWTHGQIMRFQFSHLFPNINLLHRGISRISEGQVERDHLL